MDKLTPSRVTVGFVGLGGMGTGMASRLLDCGFGLRVYNRSPERARPLAELGAVVADTPAEAARGASAIVLSLSDERAVAEVVDGPFGLLAGLGPQALLVDTSTTSPEFACELGERVRTAGGRFVNACVLGNPGHARSGELRVFAGARPGGLDAVSDVLGTIGKETTLLGPVGAGSKMKIVLNLLMGIQMAGLAEAIAVGESSGLRQADLLRAIAGSGYASPMVSFRCAMIGRRAYSPPAFRLALMAKDMRLVSERAGRDGRAMPVATAAGELLQLGVEAGLGDLDTAAIVALAERHAGLEPEWPGAGEPIATPTRARR